MKHIITILVFTLSFSCFSQDRTFTTNYKLTPSGQIAKENFSFNFSSDGNLYVYDNDLRTKRVFSAEFSESFYDKDNHFQMMYNSDPNASVLEHRPKDQLGAFTIIYDEKNGNILGAKILVMSNPNNSELYLTEMGKQWYNQN